MCSDIIVQAGTNLDPFVFRSYDENSVQFFSIVLALNLVDMCAAIFGNDDRLERVCVFSFQCLLMR